MAGGTGGHIFPALAVARELSARGATVSWLGTRTGMEARIVPDEGIEIDWIAVRGLRGKGIGSWMMAPFKFAVAVMQAMVIVFRRRPAAVLGMGGFAAGPGGFAAWLLRRRLVIHEQNAVAGLTNRLLAPLATVVLAGFPGAFPPRPNVVITGNPVRPEIFRECGAVARPHPGRPRVLVIGGSLGAMALNETVPAALALLAEDQRPEVRHQTGMNHCSATRERYREFGVEAEVEPFIENMAQAYAWADYVICRAGALTVSELAAAGTAAILVPYPHAVDDHQTRNAAFLVDAGAAILVPQSELSAQRLSEVMNGMIRPVSASSGELLWQQMARQARRCARPDATQVVASYCLAEGK